MQETEFISQNKEKWKEFEDVLRSNNKDPNRLTNLFIETTDDLSYSRTYYPNRSVRVYLNGISQQVFQAIYKNKAKDKNLFSHFWKIDLPEAMWHHRKALLQSFLVFLLGLTIGTVSSIYYPDFARIILGDSYIEMTQANIDNGDPMAVYKDGGVLESFFTIAFNNIRVAFLTFVTGILFAIGTYYVVFFNAIMVGAFVYFFIERGLFKESFLAIMLHGTLELSMIVIAGCAGLALSRGLIFPGTYSRMQALMNSARNGIKMMIAVTVFLFYAAFIESFVTRFTELKGVENGQLIVDGLRLILVLISAAIVLGYFVIYPRYRFKKGLISPEKTEDLPYRKETNIDLTSIKKVGRIFTESFYFFSRNAKKAIATSVLLSITITIYFGIVTKGDYNSIFERGRHFFGFDRFIWVWGYFNQHINFKYYPILFPIIILLFTFWFIVVRNLFLTTISKASMSFHKSIKKALPPALLISTPLLFTHGWTILTMPLVMPFAMLWFCTITSENLNVLEGLKRTLQLLKGNFWKMISLFFLVISIIWLTFFSLNSQLLDLVFEFIRLNLPHTSKMADQMHSFLYTFLLFAILSFMFTLILHSMGLLYFTIKEINEAPYLSSAIHNIGKKKRAYGLEQEA